MACANMASVKAATDGGADRIELCAALDAGGLTPSDGFIREALRFTSVPVFVMIRPREGDFLYSADEFEIMLKDIERCRSLGVPGIVTGVLNSDGRIDRHQAGRILDAAAGMAVTFHRAFDLSIDAQQSFSDLIELGFHRLLTSGMAASAPAGTDCIRQLVLASAGKITVMAGAGIRPENVSTIVKNTGVREVHLSGKALRHSKMTFRRGNLSMGAPDMDEYSISVTDQTVISAVRKALDNL